MLWRFSQLNPLVKSLIGALVFHAACYVLWGVYYGEYLDHYFNAYIDGTFTAGVTKPLFYNYGMLPGTSQLLAWAYDAWPNVNWYGWLKQAFMLLNTTGLLWLLMLIRHGYNQHKGLGAALILFILPFWCYHVVWLRLTEMAFLACGIGIVGIIATYTVLGQAVFSKLMAARIFFLLLLLLSAHIRVESALLGLAIFAPAALLVIKHRAASIGFLKISLAVVPVFLGSYALYLSAIGPAEKLFQESRVYTYTLWDFGQETNRFNLTTAADSIKLEATQKFFIADEAGMSPEFYDRIGVYKREKSVGALGSYMDGLSARYQRACGIWQFYWQQYTSFFISYFLILVVSIGLVAGFRTWKPLLLLLFVQVGFWLVLFAVTLLMKMEMRVLAPLLTTAFILLALWPLLLTKTEVLPALPKAGVWAGIFILISAGCFKLVEVQREARGFKTGKENIGAFKQELAAKQDRIVVFNSLAWLLLYEDLLDTNQFASNPNFISIDNGELFMYPEFKQTMLACCNGYKVDDVARFLLANKERVIFVSHNDRMDLLQRYIETVYGIPFSSKPAYPNSVLSNPKGGKMIPGYTDHIDYSYYVLE